MLPVAAYSYPLTALEPVFTELNMSNHLTHWKAYQTKFTAAVAGTPLENQPLLQTLRTLETVPATIRGPVRNTGGGLFNHAVFFSQFPANCKFSSALLAAIEAKFGSVQGMLDEIEKAGMTGFGSGWVWLLRRPDGLALEWTPNQDVPQAGRILLAVDCWEHAFYNTYGPNKAGYLQNMASIINWGEVSRRFEEGYAGEEVN